MSVDFIVGVLFVGFALAAALVYLTIAELTKRVSAVETLTSVTRDHVDYVRKIVDMPADMHDIARNDILRDARKGR